MRLHGRLLVTCLLVLSGTAGCEGDPTGQEAPTGDAQVSSLEIPQGDLSLLVGDSIRLSAVARDWRGQALPKQKVRWYATPYPIVSVSGDGMVKTGALGTGYVRAESGGRFQQVTVSVVSPARQLPGEVATVSVTPATATLAPGASGQLIATVRDAAGNVLTGHTVSWLSSSTAVVAVTGSGVMTAVSSGTARVVATVESKADTAVLEVAAPAPAPVASVVVSPATLSLVTGATQQLSATLRDASGNLLTGRSVTWSSSNTAVATAGGSGLVTAWTAGTASVIALAEGRADTVPVVVSAPAPVGSVTATPASVALVPGGTSQLVVTLRDASGAVLTGRPISWTSSTPTVASVSASGLVSAIASGSAHVMATSEGRADTVAVTVTQAAVASVTVSPASVSLEPGGTRQLSVTLRDAVGNVLTGRAVAWSSSRTGVATVSGTGVVTAVGEGSANIAAVSEGRSGAASIVVTSTNAPPVAPTLTAGAITSTGVTLNGTAFSDPDSGDTHATSQWLIDELNGDWSTPVVSVISSTDLTTRVITGLTAGASYKALVRYQDSRGAIGAFSTQLSFIATASTSTNTPPATPTATVSGITNTTATIAGASFSDPNAGDTHAASEWQVTTSGGSWSFPVAGAVQSGSSRSFSVSGLAASTGYQARVRYQDSRGAWSAWSASAAFQTTGSTPPLPPPTGATVLFSSNWDYATGNGRDAVEDGPVGARPWSRLCSGTTGVADVVSGRPMGWSLTPHVMQINRMGSQCTQVETGSLSGLQPGQDYYIRTYIRNDASDDPSGQVPSNHPVCINCLGEIQFALWAQETSGAPAGQYFARLFNRGALDAGGSLRPAAAASGVTLSDLRWKANLSNGVWYRFEWHVEFVNVRATDADVRIWPRVYDMAGNLIRDADDYTRLPGWGGPGSDMTETLRHWYDAGHLFVFPSLSLSRNFGLGYEGPAGATSTGQRWYYGAPAVGVGDWIGPAAF